MWQQKIKILIALHCLIVTTYSWGAPRDYYLDLPNGETMHYTASGNVDGKVLLMVHGWPASARLYEPVMDELCDSSHGEYLCIAISQIGFGDSSCPGNGSVVTPSYQVDRLDEFIEIMNFDDFAVVVHDWGGVVGTAAALRHSDELSHIVILNTFYRFDQGLLGLASRVLGPWFSRSLVSKTFASSIVTVTMQSLTTSWLNLFERMDYRRPFDSWERSCKMRAGLNLFNHGLSRESLDLYDDLAEDLTSYWQNEPALFLWGTVDPVLGPYTVPGQRAHNYMQELLPQAETIMIRGASHFMQEDKPREIAEHIRDFVQW